MSKDSNIEELARKTFENDWVRVLEETINSSVFGEDATHRVSLLKSAQKKPLSVSSKTSIRHAVTLMMENDYSQLPVLEDDKTVEGMFSWRSYGKRLAMGQECETVSDAMESAQVLDLDAWLFEAFAAISKNDVVLIQNKKREICGIITAYDVSETFVTLVEPFILVEEVEKHVRALLRDCVQEGDLKEVAPAKPSHNGKPRISDLNFGGYVALLKKDDVWNRLALNLERTVFIQSLTDVRKIRNDVMHFRPMGIGEARMSKLRNFAKFLREIRLLRQRQNDVER